MKLQLTELDNLFNKNKHYCPVKIFLKYGMPLFYYVPTGLLRKGVAFCLYRYFIPNGIVPWGQNIGRKNIAFALKSPVGT